MNGLKMKVTKDNNYFNTTLTKYRDEIKFLDNMKETLWETVWRLHRKNQELEETITILKKEKSGQQTN